MSRAGILFLSAEDVRRALPMKEAVEAMRAAFARLSSGEAVVPSRTHLALPEENADALIMPCYSPGDRRVGLKVIALHRDNPKKGLPLIHALIIVLDAADGTPLAVLDGASLTAIRTGAASGVATDVLARREAAAAAIFGAGAQGETQLEAICTVRSIRSARVFDLRRAIAEDFARRLSGALGIRVDAAASPAEALDGVDVACTATTSKVPVFEDADLPPGVHINAIGSYKPAEREVPPETVRRARVVVDRIDAALEEAGDIILPMQSGCIGPHHIHAELGEIILGRKTGRAGADEITLFKSVGSAIQDLCAATRAIENARRLGLGRTC